MKISFDRLKSILHHLKDLKTKPNVLIACIIRGGKIIIPRGDDRLEAKDSVIVVTANQYLRDLSDILL